MLIAEYDYATDIAVQRAEERKIAYTEGKSLGLAEGKSLGLAEGKSLGLAEGEARGRSEGSHQANDYVYRCTAFFSMWRVMYEIVFNQE